MAPEAPIGIFDSGVGGLTVARAVIDQLPGESITYVGDTQNGPYGPLSLGEIREHALAVADHLVDSGVKLLVVACNTASASCYEELTQRYSIPVLEVIRPATRRALRATHTGRIGVLGTAATVRSGAYDAAFNDLGVPGSHTVTSAACPRFVDFVERGITSGRQILGLAQAYLAPLQAADVDTVVLGCTHYPLLSGVIQLAAGDPVTLVSSAEETAKDVYRVLTEAEMLAPTGQIPKRVFQATGDPRSFKRLADRFLGPSVSEVSAAR